MPVVLVMPVEPAVVGLELVAIAVAVGGWKAEASVVAVAATAPRSSVLPDNTAVAVAVGISALLVILSDSPTTVVARGGFSGPDTIAGGGTVGMGGGDDDELDEELDDEFDCDEYPELLVDEIFPTSGRGGCGVPVCSAATEERDIAIVSGSSSNTLPTLWYSNHMLSREGSFKISCSMCDNLK